MPKAGIVIGIGVAVLATGCGSGRNAQTLSIHSAATPVVSRTLAVYLPSTCLNQVQRPSGFVIACADGGSGVEQIKWRAWGGSVSWGVGFAYANDCQPNCVAGGVHHAEAEIYARRPQKCGAHVQYTYVVVIAAESSYAQRVTGAYTVGCGEPGGSGVSRTQPEDEAGEAVKAKGAPSDREVHERLRQLQEKEEHKHG